MNLKSAKVVTIASLKGGAGKTAITSLLARYLVEIEGRKVIVIDLDGRGGITSLFNHKPVTATTPSIVELLLESNQQLNMADLISQAVIPIENNDTLKWRKNRGRLYLIPSKPSLDAVLIGNNSILLKSVLNNLRLSKDWIILIDSGPDSKNIEMSLVAAGLVFVPIILGKQDVHPTIETIHSIIDEQRNNGKPIFGGLIINRSGQTQWEDSYVSSYQELVDLLMKDSGLLTMTTDLFIELKQSRIIQRGKHLSWSWRKDILKSAKRIAAVIQQDEN